jgi:hypothetical protein
MSVMGEPMYTLHTGRGGHHAQDLTPYSAVRSQIGSRWLRSSIPSR